MLKAATKKRREQLVQDLSPKNKSHFFNSEEEHRDQLEVNNIEIGSEEIMDMKPIPELGVEKQRKSKNIRSRKNELSKIGQNGKNIKNPTQDSNTQKAPHGEFVLESFDDSSSN